MKKDEKAMKTRQTKLSKKTNEDLINIILKKDNVEKGLANQISRLKGEVSAHQDVNKNLRNDITGMETTLLRCRNKLSSLNEEYKIISTDLLNAKTSIHELNVEAAEKRDKYYKVSIYAIIVTIIAVIEFLFIVF